MKWTPGGVSKDVEDRRGETGGGGGFGGGRIRLGLGGALVLLVLSLIFRQNLFQFLDTGAAPGTAPSGVPAASTPAEDTLV